MCAVYYDVSYQFQWLSWPWLKWLDWPWTVTAHRPPSSCSAFAPWFSTDRNNPTQLLKLTSLNKHSHCTTQDTYSHLGNYKSKQIILRHLLEVVIVLMPLHLVCIVLLLSIWKPQTSLWREIQTWRSFLRAGCSLSEWLRRYCITGSSFLPTWLLPDDMLNTLDLRLPLRRNQRKKLMVETLHAMYTIKVIFYNYHSL